MLRRCCSRLISLAIYPLSLPCRERRTDVLGADVADVCRRAAVRRLILKPEKPADLLVQAPTKYELVINRKRGRRCLVQRYSAPRRDTGTGLANSWLVVQKP